MDRRYYIRTFGCQMNVADSEAMAGILRARGFLPADRPEEADIMAVNTCTIRRKAEDKAVSELGRMLFLKRRRQGVPLVIAAGCVARKEGPDLLRRLPGLDIVVGPSRLARLGELLDLRETGGKPVVDVGDQPAGPFPSAPVRQSGVIAFVSIMRGCDNACAYCVVPSVRGGEASLPPEDIEAEVRRLADQGYREVTLLGQNVNSYGKGLAGRPSFPALLERLDRRTGIRRLRFTTSHPKDFTPELAMAVRDLPSVCEAVHLPVQAGSDRVLAAMKRGYTAGEFMEKISFLREAVPGVALSTDIIVGFPGEGADDFAATLALVSRAGFAGLFAFKFSPREGTPAAGRPDDVPPEEKDRRLQSVLRLQRGITLEFNRRQVGLTAEVLVEGPAKTGAGQLTGRTRGNTVVNFPGGDDQTGRLLPVEITGAGPNSLRGRAAPSSP